MTGSDQQLNTTDAVTFKSVTLQAISDGYFGRITALNESWFQGVSGDDDGNIYAVGGIYDNDEYISLIYKADSNGNEIWRKSVSGTG